MVLPVFILHNIDRKKDKFMFLPRELMLFGKYLSSTRNRIPKDRSEEIAIYRD